MKRLLSLFGGGSPSKFVTEVKAVTIHVGIDAAVSAVVRFVKDHHSIHRELYGSSSYGCKDAIGGGDLWALARATARPATLTCERAGIQAHSAQTGTLLCHGLLPNLL